MVIPLYDGIYYYNHCYYYDIYIIGKAEIMGQVDIHKKIIPSPFPWRGSRLKQAEISGQVW